MKRAISLTVRVPGSCGELMQGQIDDIPFLVTCPINKYVAVTIHPNRSQDDYFIGDKAKRAIQVTCDYLNVPSFSSALEIVSELPVGKGMASSSADILATCHAVALSFGKRLGEQEAFRLALQVEPTDAVCYRGIVLADHIGGRRFERMGEAPRMKIAVFDYGGMVDTVAFNARRDLIGLNRAKQQRISEALFYIRKGFLTNNTAFIGKGATISAIANQPILYKEGLMDIIQIAKEEGAVGVNVAHSGTVLGVLFDESSCKNYERCIARVEEAVSAVRFYTDVNLVSGGVEIGGKTDE